MQQLNLEDRTKYRKSHQEVKAISLSIQDLYHSSSLQANDMQKSKN